MVSEPFSQAQDEDPVPLQLQDDLRVSAGSNIIVTLPEPADRVALADEKAALLRVVSERELLVTGTTLAQTTIHVWLKDGSRLLYPLSVGRDLTLLQEALQDISSTIRVAESADGRTLILRGQVETAAEANEAEERARQFFGGGTTAAAAGEAPAIVNLIKYSVGSPSFERELAEALADIDPRIQLRRIRVERPAFDASDPAAAAGAGLADDYTHRDSFVLHGRVKNLRMLMRALELADRYLGGVGGPVYAPQHVPIQGGRNNLAIGNNFNLGGGAFGNSPFGGSGAIAGNQALGNTSFGSGSNAIGGAGLGFFGDTPPAGLANLVSRGLNITTSGGRVVSFLEVDALDQIMVSIRVLEIDRRRARSLGINYVVNSTDFAIGNFTSPTGRFGVADLVGSAVNQIDDVLIGSGAAGGAAGIGSGANIVGAYVGDSLGINAAIDFLEQRGVGRSVAEPNVLTLTGEQSTIEVGGQVPIPTTAATNAAAFQGVFFQNFGVRLDIRPTLDDNGIITLEASPTIIEPDEGINVEGVPGFATQSVATTARVKGDQSLVIGGLINYDEAFAERKVPVLGNIPVIKPLFRWKRKLRNEHELLFVITPHVREDLGVNGEQRAFDLPDLDSREETRFRDQAEPVKATPEGIPLNWLEIDEELPPGANGPVPPSRPQPVWDEDSSKNPVSTQPDPDPQPQSGPRRRLITPRVGALEAPEATSDFALASGATGGHAPPPEPRLEASAVSYSPLAAVGAETHAFEEIIPVPETPGRKVVLQQSPIAMPQQGTGMQASLLPVLSSAGPPEPERRVGFFQRLSTRSGRDGSDSPAAGGSEFSPEPVPPQADGVLPPAEEEERLFKRVRERSSSGFGRYRKR